MLRVASAFCSAASLSVGWCSAARQLVEMARTAGDGAEQLALLLLKEWMPRLARAPRSPA